MRYKRGRQIPDAEGDMTPMIDMTFQLIAFFMILINFSEGDQNQLIRLPASELAKPPDTAPAWPITLQMTARGTVFYGVDEFTMENLRPVLEVEKELISRRGGDFRNTTIIIRADRYAKTGRVQELIRLCQTVGFEKFTLRAKQESP
ncbi:Biopolymer transport protein ExbD/TolR [Thermogutta terrifontis]|jgi:biopolymer transport protein ExbD|uniref:Biopolymer transport protein ExbD/TolR n=1 Tax=Thermogutta terrifontis TaxID=1331910 RepID=A0A286RJ74_9BACT|nr:biopolymer transporter ExbD [Thermogutta terrifontis]ASV76008.1 Biopolymer transport protein ExbD/TolR [Thermogutta terrifontis]